MFIKLVKAVIGLFLIILLLSIESRNFDALRVETAEAASPPAQQGNSRDSGPELDAADPISLFWHPVVNGAKSLNRPSVRHSELGISSAEARDPKKVALAFVHTQRSGLGLAATNEMDWQVIRLETEKGGTAHVALQQLYKELPVFAGQMIVHTRDTVGVIAANGEYPPAINLSTKPKLSAETAYKIAHHELALAGAVVTEQELLVFNPALLGIGASANHLSYRFVAERPEVPEKRVIFVDAHTGKLLFTYNELQEGLNRAIYDLHNSTTLPGTQCYNEAGPISGGSPSADCTNAYNFTGDTYNYFLNTHGRDSFNNNGATMQVSVRYGTEANAFWNGVQTTYGSGFATKDVVAHEWGHAVTEYSAGLVYAYQSGALNESMSDIFGTMVDRNDWLMGEDTPIGAIRSLEDPNVFDDPKSVNDENFYCGTADQGGVHTNSGVPNHTAYLVAEGGSLNGVNVTGVGRNNTEKVFYRALTTYMTSGSNFSDAANALTSACSDLFGANSATCTTVSDALAATQMTAPVCSSTDGVPDSYEPDNSAATASTITTDGATQAHNIHTPGDNDFVSFSATNGADYVIETSSLGAQADTVLYLYDTDGTTQIATDDDGGDGLASRIAWTASANGTYYARVRHYSAGAAGSGTDYDLSVTGSGGTPGTDTYEPDDSAAQARAITPNGGIQTHNFHDAGDVDWVQFSATSDSGYVIETLNLGSESDTVLELYGTDGSTLLLMDDDGGDELASRIEWSAPSSGTYFAKVRHFSDQASGPNTVYDLKVTTSNTLADSFEPDDASGQASNIVVDDPAQTHNFHVAGDQDWVRFSATAGMGYVIETTNLGSSSDTVMELFDTNGTTLLEIDDDGGNGLASRIDWAAPNNGTYFVRVTHFSNSSYGATTNYDLSVVSAGAGGLADSYEDDDLPNQASTITVGGDAQTHNFHDAGDEDWIRFQAEVGVNYTIQTFNLGAASDTVMGLFDTDGSTLLAFNDDGGVGLASRIDWVAPANGTYFINIYHYAGAFGDDTNYDLEVIGIGDPTPDSYEADNTPGQATPITLGQTQADHNFHTGGDQDWVSFSASAGTIYVLQTLNLGSRSDTVLELYDTDGTTLLEVDDDGGGGLASRIVWTAPGNGTYFAKVRHFFSGVGGANTDYDLRLSGNDAEVDEFEPDNTPAQATPISTDGAPQTHNFHVAGDVDWLTFTASSNGNYLIETSNLGSTSDTFLELYDTDGSTLLTSNDDGGVGLASRINWTASGAGNYYVKVRHYSDTAGGPNTNYDVQVNTVDGGGDDYEPDNTFAQANSIPVNGLPQSHNFHVAGDQDWRFFSATAGATYIIETSNLGPQSDTYLYLYDSNGTTVLESDDDGGDEPLASRIEWTAPVSNDYYIQIRHYSSNAFGPLTSYDVAVTSSDGGGGDDFEPDNTYTLANPITVNGALQTHDFHFAGDQDWVQFEATSGSTYFIETLNLGSLGDTILNLYNTNGTTLLESDDDGGDGLASRIEWAAPADGTYFVQVTHFSGSIFGPDTSYDLRITSDSISGLDAYEPDDSAGQASPIDVDPPIEIQTHNFHAAGDQDWVVLADLLQSQICTIQTLNLGSQSDTYIEFYDVDLNLVASDDDGGPGLASRLVLEIPAAGSYYLKVRHYSDQIFGPATNYDLSITCTGLGLPDGFEDDDTAGQAKTIPTDGSLATHNFDSAGDQDWSQFTATAGTSYVIETTDLGANSDTVMTLYDTDGSTIIDSDDDGGDGFASLIDWTAPSNGTYFVKVVHFDTGAFGPDTNYNLSVRESSGEITTGATVELTNPEVRVGDEVEAVIYLEESMSAIKVEAHAKATYLDLIEVTPLGPEGQALGQEFTGQADQWQLETADKGLVSVNYTGKFGSDSSQTVPVLRLRWRLTEALPQAKMNIPVQMTTIDRNGQAISQDFNLTLVMLGDEPKIDDVSPKIFANDVNTVLSILGSNFEDTPKVYLVAGNQEIQLIEVEIVVPDPGDPFVRATVPANTKTGSYKVRLVNPDQSSTEYSSIEITAESSPGLEYNVYLPLIQK